VKRYRAKVRLFDRRDVLRLGGATLAGAALGACGESLDLPPAVPLESIDPVTPTGDFYVQSCCGREDVNPDAWRLSIRGAGTEIGSLDMAYFQSLSTLAREKEHTLECIGGSPHYPQISNAIWKGLPLPEILEDLEIAVPASAVEIRFECADGYYVTVPASDLVKPLWLVWEMNGAPLTAAHGAPARILNPGRYGTKNPKWIVAIDFIDEAELGYWEERGWSNDAVYLANGYILSPPTLTEADRAGVLLLGTAFAGSDAIAKVEITSDGRETWEDAEVTYSPGPDVWTLWQYEWRPPGPGTYRLQVRVTTESGAQSHTEAPQGTDQLHGYDGGMEIELEVT
jgi:hypothetical protein